MNPRQSSKGSENRKIRYAVVGLGHIAQDAVLPAFAHASENSELVGLVSDNPEKLKKFSKTLGVKNLWSYKDYDKALKSGEIDAVYIALPNHMHKEFAIKAAKAGVHILVEKPMAMNTEEGDEIVRAARENKVRLMVGYRLHFEAANLHAVELLQSGKIGEPRIFSSIFTFQVREGNVRTRRAFGGGALEDIGIYCINAARYLFRDEPLDVTAVVATDRRDERFAEIPEITSVIMRFPKDRIATFTCAFGSAPNSQYQIVGTKGNLFVDPAYEYLGDLKHRLVVDGKTIERTFEARDQFAPELIHFSDCIINGHDPEPCGKEGLADLRVIDAVKLSARLGRTVQLEPFSKSDRPSMLLEMKHPPVKERVLVGVTPSSK